MADDALEQLYAHLTAGRKPGVRDLKPEERRAYNRDASRRRGEKERKAVAAGSPEPTDGAVRDALADAALALLAVDGPGADEIRKVLDRAFAGRPGVPGTVTARARAGSLRPKLLKSS